MRELSARDFARLQRAILALYSHRDLGGFRRAVPGIFLEMIRADHFRLGDFRIDARRKLVHALDWWESRPLLGAHRLPNDEQNLFDHPFTQYVLKHGRSHRAIALSDFLTLPQLRRTQVYRERIKPTNGGRLLGIYSVGGPGIAVLSFSRPETDRDFTGRDRRILETLQPHFDQARASLERETQLRANRSLSLKAHGLTARETDVALWLAQGKSNSEIGTILVVPVRTIEKHVERILRKMGVENRASAALTVNEIIHA